MRFAAVDLSLTGTGICWGIARPGHSPSVVTMGSSGHADDDLPARSMRLRMLADRVFRHVSLADVVAVEGPALGSTTGHVWDRAGLWWLLVARLDGYGIPVVEVSPSNVKKYATGKGNAGKDQVLAAVVRRYPTVEVADNNQADALAMAAMVVRRYGAPIETQLPLSNLAAMATVRWPELNTKGT